MGQQFQENSNIGRLTGHSIYKMGPIEVQESHLTDLQSKVVEKSAKALQMYKQTGNKELLEHYSNSTKSKTKPVYIGQQQQQSPKRTSPSATKQIDQRTPSVQKQYKMN